MTPPRSNHTRVGIRLFAVRLRLLAACLTGLTTIAIASPPPNIPPAPLVSVAADLKDPPIAVVESFTRSIQPLLLNRCATAGCHVGPAAPAPRFLHRNARGHIDREVTLANLRTLERLSDDGRSFDDLMRDLLTAHPGRRDEPRLTTASATTVRRWLAAKRSIEAAPDSITPQSPPNRFRLLLDAAANPAPIWPPPQEPRGIILPEGRTIDTTIDSD